MVKIWPILSQKSSYRNDDELRAGCSLSLVAGFRRQAASRAAGLGAFSTLDSGLPFWWGLTIGASQWPMADLLPTRPSSLQFREPRLHVSERPLRRLVRMAGVATIRVAVLDGLGWGDEIKRVIARFARDGIAPGLGHVALDASAAGAERVMVRVLRKDLVLRTGTLAGPVAREAQRIGVGRLDVERPIARAV